jgi:hypothetical protein
MIASNIYTIIAVTAWISSRSLLWQPQIVLEVFLSRYMQHTLSKNKSKAVPLEAWTGPWGSGRLRPRIFLTFGTRRW